MTDRQDAGHHDHGRVCIPNITCKIPKSSDRLGQRVIATNLGRFKSLWICGHTWRVIGHFEHRVDRR